MKKKQKARAHSLVDGIINKKALIEKLFIIAVVISVLCVPFVGVNYDLSKYLPDSANSKQGLNLMTEEFGYPGTARVMVGEVSLYEAKVYKDRIAALDGVDMVNWCDTTTNIYQSSLFIQYDKIDEYYKDGYAVMDIIFEEGDADKPTHKAIDQIEEILGDKGYMMGSAVQNKSLSETLTRQIAIAMVMGVVMIYIILTLTTRSWFEPIMFLAVMGIAIVINMGTNIFLGTISFLTFSMAAILQLAIAMDYSIFLLHTFQREKSTGQDSVQAIASALRAAVSSILSSGATTIVGFIVLTLMQFTIGRDMGIVLAKGIVISLLTVLLLMPALILRWDKLIEKTQHRSFMPSFDGLGKVVFKLRNVVLIVVAVLVVPAFAAQNMNVFQFGNGALGSSPGTKVYDDEQAINGRFGRSNLLLAIIPNTSNVTEKELSQEIEDLEYTKSVTSLAGMLPDGVPESILPESITGQVHTQNYARMLIYIKTADESDLAFRCTDEIRDIVEKHYPEGAYVVGMTPSTQDIKKIITVDYNRVNILSLLGVAIVVLFTFKSPIIPIVVMIPIEVAIFFNMALPYLFGDKMIYMGYIIVSCLQLGATIDYSILLTNNYLDARVGMEKKQAAIHAISASALSVLTSGSILTIVGYGLYFTSTVAAIADMGRLVGRGALLSIVLVLSMLPILLTIFDQVIVNQQKRMAYLQRIRKIRQKKVALSIAFRRKERHKQFQQTVRDMKREQRVLDKAEREQEKQRRKHPPAEEELTEGKQETPEKAAEQESRKADKEDNGYEHVEKQTSEQSEPKQTDAVSASDGHRVRRAVRRDNRRSAACGHHRRSGVRESRRVRHAHLHQHCKRVRPQRTNRIL